MRAIGRPRRDARNTWCKPNIVRARMGRQMVSSSPKRHHYVPRMLFKRFADADERIWVNDAGNVYRTNYGNAFSKATSIQERSSVMLRKGPATVSS